MSILIAVTLGIWFELLLESLVFLISYSFIRMYAGGYHCKKAIHCYVMSMVIMVVVLMLVRITPVNYVLPISVIVLIISVPILVKLAPLGTENKPLDEVEIRHYRKKTIIHLSIELFIILTLLFARLHTLAFVMCIGIIVVVAVLVLEKQIQNKNLGGS